MMFKLGSRAMLLFLLALITTMSSHLIGSASLLPEPPQMIAPGAPTPTATPITKALPPQLKFTENIDSWTERAVPTIADINNDGRQEMLLPTYNTGTAVPGKIYAWDTANIPLPGFPINTDGHVRGRLALADLNHDGKLEIAAGVDSFQQNTGPKVYVWLSDGRIMPGWPQYTECLPVGQDCSVSSVAIADVDGDGELDVVASTDNREVNISDPNLHTPNLYAWHSNGVLLAGKWPGEDEANCAIIGAVALADMNKDGKAEIALGRDYNRIFVYDNQGSSLPGWPVRTWWPVDRNNWDDDQIEFPRSSTTLADLDGDGVPEFIISGLRRHADESTYLNSDLLVYGANGARWKNWETPASSGPILTQVSWRMIEAPAVADINKDGHPDIIVATQDGFVRAYTPEKRSLWAFNYAQGKVLHASETVIGDVDGDGWNEVVFGTFDPTYGSTGPVGVYILDHNGALKPGAPMWVESPGITGAPTLADFDGDGKAEIAAASVTGKIYLWDETGKWLPSSFPWPMARSDLQRTGLYSNVPSFGQSWIETNIWNAQAGDAVDFTLHLIRSGTPLGDTISLANTLPVGVQYVPGSIKTTAGQVDDSQAPILKWSGSMQDISRVDISYSVTVTKTTPGAVTNSAEIDAGSLGQFSIRRVLITNGETNFLSNIRH